MYNSIDNDFVWPWVKIKKNEGSSGIEMSFEKMSKTKIEEIQACWKEGGPPLTAPPPPLPSVLPALIYHVKYCAFSIKDCWR